MGYGQFCPIAKAAEVISEKWTLIIIRDILSGSNTFNKLKRSIPLISPTLLSKRLNELELAQLIKKEKTQKVKPKFLYLPTQAALELGPLLIQIGEWGNRWAVSNLSREDYDPRFLMSNLQRHVNFEPFIKKQTKYTVFFQFEGVQTKLAYWWLVIDVNQADICLKDPGYEINLYIKTHIKTMTDIWMGWQTLVKAKREKKIIFEGSKRDIDLFPKWLKLNIFAPSTTA